MLLTFFKRAFMCPLFAGQKVCAEWLIAPMPLPCGHSPKAITKSLHSKLRSNLNAAKVQEPPVYFSAPKLDATAVEVDACFGSPGSGLCTDSVRSSNLPLMLVVERLGARRVVNHSLLVSLYPHPIMKRQ